MVKKSFYILATVVSEVGIQKQGKYISKIYNEKNKGRKRNVICFYINLPPSFKVNLLFFCLFVLSLVMHKERKKQKENNSMLADLYQGRSVVQNGYWAKEEVKSCRKRRASVAIKRTNKKNKNNLELKTPTPLSWPDSLLY